MADIGEINNLGKLNLVVEHKIIENILAFHQKTTYLLDQRFAKYGQFPISAQALKQFEFTDNEISPFYHESIEVRAGRDLKLRRNPSQLHFQNKKMSFNDLQTLLHESFSGDQYNKRPYPSGGGLYPAEVLVIMIQERMHGAPATGVYHYRPLLKLLQKLKPTTLTDLYRGTIIESIEQIGMPCILFVYIMNLQKATVKYNYRGYRNAILEVGSMYQQADLVAKELDIKNRLSSSFSDQELTKYLELDRHVYLPLVIQYFGY